MYIRCEHLFGAYEVCGAPIGVLLNWVFGECFDIHTPLWAYAGAHFMLPLGWQGASQVIAVEQHQLHILYAPGGVSWHCTFLFLFLFEFVFEFEFKFVFYLHLHLYLGVYLCLYCCWTAPTPYTLCTRSRQLTLHVPLMFALFSSSCSLNLYLYQYLYLGLYLYLYLQKHTHGVSWHCTFH